MSAVIQSIQNACVNPVFQGWEEFVSDNAPDWLSSIRMRAFHYLSEHDVPTPKSERFKYINIPEALKKMSLSAGSVEPSAEGKTAFMHPLMDYINAKGEPAAELMREILSAPPAGEDQYGDMALWYAANAFMKDGVVIDVPRDTVQNDPLTLNVTGENNLFFTLRNIFNLRENSDFSIIENISGTGEYWSNNVTQIRVKKGATLRHYRFQNASPEALLTQNTHVIVEEGGTYEAFVLTQGAATSRNQVHVELIGEHAVCHLNGANMLRDTQVGDTTITIEHKAPHCQSNQDYRSVLKHRARGIFQGKVHVHQIAQKTDGYQLSNALILSDGAEMNTKPELEIYADDVKCSHGALTGKLEETPLFYLRSRGIPEDEARKLLIEAFIAEVVDKVEDKSVQENILEQIRAWLERT